MRWLPSTKCPKERECLTGSKSKQARWGRLPQYPMILRCSRRRSKVQVWKTNNEFGRGQTNLFGRYSYCRTLAFEYGDRCGYWPISNPVSRGSSSTQSSQTWIHWWFGPRYTQQVTEQGSLQYLQPFEGCRHIRVCKIVATQVADRDMTVCDFTVIPGKIKTRGQTMLTIHSISGTFVKDSF